MQQIPIHWFLFHCCCCVVENETFQFFHVRFTETYVPRTIWTGSHFTRARNHSTRSWKFQIRKKIRFNLFKATFPLKWRTIIYSDSEGFGMLCFLQIGIDGSTLIRIVRDCVQFEYEHEYVRECMVYAFVSVSIALKSFPLFKYQHSCVYCTRLYSVHTDNRFKQSLSHFSLQNFFLPFVLCMF